MANRKMPKRLISDLEEAIERLQPENERRSEHVSEALNSEAARLYLDTWVLPQLEDIKRWAEGEHINLNDPYRV